MGTQDWEPELSSSANKLTHCLLLLWWTLLQVTLWLWHISLKWMKFIWFFYILIFNSQIVSRSLMFSEILYLFLMSCLPMAASNWMQTSQFLTITYITSGKFCRSLPPKDWTPWFEHQWIWGISFWKAEMPLQFIKQVRHLQMIFSFFLCKSEFIIWGFPSFLAKSSKWYILVARTCESCQIASQQGQAWARKQDPRRAGELHWSLAVLRQP